MYFFILQMFIMLSLAGIVFLVARTLPRISETELSPNKIPKRFDLLNSIPFERLDALVNKFLEKFLRRIKLILMKMDNSISRVLSKFKRENNNRNNKENNRANLDI